MSARRYILDCDRCNRVLGTTTDGSYPSRGITLCVNCERKEVTATQAARATR